MGYAVIEENNLIFVDSMDLGDAYDWSEIAVYYSKEKRRYFWVSGSGCSCTSLWDDIRSLEDMENGPKTAAVNAVRSFAEENRRYYPNDVVGATSKIKSFTP